MSRAPATIRASEAAHFGQLAADWWDPKGSSAMLHKLNPVRLAYVRAQVDARWGFNPAGLKPLAGKTVLDVGCGAGLLCEPLARLGATATGIDAAPENIAVAVQHATGAGLAIEYRCGEVGKIKRRYDLVTSMEVIEHVADPAEFVVALASRLAPDGLLILSTPNRTQKSRLAMITLGEGLGMIPKGTHNWSQFLTPDEVASLASKAGLVALDTRGISFSPTRGLHLSDDLSLNFIMAFVASRP